jgi:hypothetical protein
MRCRGGASLPWPAAVNLKNESPAQECPYKNQASQQTEASERQLDSNRLYDIGRNQYFQTEQERSADANPLGIVTRGDRATINVSAGPDDPGDNDEDAKDLDANADEMNPLANGCIKGGRGFNVGSHA